MSKLRSSGTAMSNFPVEGFVQPSLGFRCSKRIMHTDNLSFFDNLEFDIFDACGPQFHFISYHVCYRCS